jgi:putative transposase
MQTPEGYRKRVKHFDDPGDCHALTFSCYRRKPLLTNDLWREMLSESITRASARHLYQLVAFVYMPEHIHLLVLPRPGASTISQYLFAIKRPFSYRIKQMLIDSESRLLHDLTIRQRPGVNTFRFWQEGSGYDRNLHSAAAIDAAMEYIHMNPVRRGLCERAVDWRWSSARYYLDDDYHPDPALPALEPLPLDYRLDLDA